MRSTFLAAILAAMLAFGSASATFAADRPVGPETGQARVGEDDGPGPGFEPDEDGFDHGNGRGELQNWNQFSCWVLRWFAGSFDPRGDCSRGVINT